MWPCGRQQSSPTVIHYCFDGTLIKIDHPCWLVSMASDDDVPFCPVISIDLLHLPLMRHLIIVEWPLVMHTHRLIHVYLLHDVKSVPYFDKVKRN